jgi:hypothetical protein
LENEIRVGLDTPTTENRAAFEQAPIDPLDVVSFGKTARRHVREFGFIFAAIFLGVAAWKLYRGHELASSLMWSLPGGLFAVLGVWAPRILLPVYRGWMKFAHYLSIVMTTVLLGVTWCVGFLPIALMVRVLGIKRMDMSFRSPRPSYWEPRDPKYDDFKRLKLQY